MDEGVDYMAEWFPKRLDEIVEFNPREIIKKGVVAKKIAMDKLQPFVGISQNLSWKLFQEVQNSEMEILLWQE